VSSGAPASRALDAFVGRRVGVFGAGVEGRSVLAQLDGLADLVLILDDPQPGHAPAVAGRDSHEVIGADLAHRARLDVVIRSAGVPVRHPALQALRASGVEVTGLLAAWLDSHPDARTVGVTGTKGKSTTSQLCADLLAAAEVEVALGGNIGVPVVELPDDAAVHVIEVSSYQASDVRRSPTVGVLTSLGEDHLTWHGGREPYWSDKLNLFAHDGLHVVVTHAPLLDHPALRRAAWIDRTITGADDPGVRLDGELLHVDDVPVPLRGLLGAPHNARNLELAVRATRAATAGSGTSIDASVVDAVVESFRGLPSRLEVIAEHGGVRVIDDALASNPMAASIAVGALTGGPVVLLAGGEDRDVDIAPFAELVRDAAHVVAVVLFSETRSRWAEAFAAAGVEPDRLVGVDTEDVAVAAESVRQLLVPGTTLLLSPAAPTPKRIGSYQDRSAALHGFADRLRGDV
jgi:UDP-N-acetylmuramoylalanine--D-glutamate ligase